VVVIVLEPCFVDVRVRVDLAVVLVLVAVLHMFMLVSVMSVAVHHVAVRVLMCMRLVVGVPDIAHDSTSRLGLVARDHRRRRSPRFG
jgi:hypothetical protein